MGQKNATPIDVKALDTANRHLGTKQDAAVAKIFKKLEGMKAQVMSGPPDSKALFDQLAEGGKISKAKFAILMRGFLNFAMKNGILFALDEGIPPADASTEAVVKDVQDKIKTEMEEGGAPSGVSAGAQAAVAVAINAVDRVDLHATKILDRIFDYLDKDKSGFLEYSELEAFMKTTMENPQSALDPFRFLSGGGDKLTVEGLQAFVNDVFAFVADIGIQCIDIFEDAACSPDVIRAIETDDALWTQFFGVAGGSKTITKKQFKAFLAQAPWEEINLQYKTEVLENPMVKLVMQMSQAQVAEFRESVLKGVSGTGQVKEGLTLVYAWLKNGVDETTFMSTMLPQVETTIKAKMEPKALAKEMVDNFTKVSKAGAVQDMKQELTAMAPVPVEMVDQVEGKFKDNAFVEAIFTDPVVTEALQKYQAVVIEKMPVLLHHMFRFCDINSDGGVSEKELKVLFALKDALVHGKLDEAAQDIFDVLDQDGNEVLTPGEMLSFYAKVMHFVAAMYRLEISVFVENLLPIVVGAVMKKISEVTGVKEATEEEVQQYFAMASGMVMMMAMGGMGGKGKGKGMPNVVNIG